MSYILIIFIYAGIFAKGDSVALQPIPGWKTKESCEAAGKALAPLVSGTAKEVRFICLPI